MHSAITPIQLKVSHAHADEFLLRAKTAFKDFYVNNMLRSVRKDETGTQHFVLSYFSARELPEDFYDCVDDFAQSAGEFLLDPVEIELTENDVVQEYFYAGATEALATAFKEACYAQRAVEALGQVGSETSDPASHVYKAIQALKVVINAGQPGAQATPSPSEKTSIAVYVLARDYSSEQTLLVVDIPLAATNPELNEHLTAAKVRVIEDGYEVVCAFDENEFAAQAINRSACVPMAYESNSETNAAVLVSDTPK